MSEDINFAKFVDGYNAYKNFEQRLDYLRKADMQKRRNTLSAELYDCKELRDVVLESVKEMLRNETESMKLEHQAVLAQLKQDQQTIMADLRKTIAEVKKQVTQNKKDREDADMALMAFEQHAADVLATTFEERLMPLIPEARTAFEEQMSGINNALIILKQRTNDLFDLSDRYEERWFCGMFRKWWK